MQLPYTPMFIPDHIPQPGTGLSMPNVAGSAAGSTIIPPNPGGVACELHGFSRLVQYDLDTDSQLHTMQYLL